MQSPNLLEENQDGQLQAYVEAGILATHGRQQLHLQTDKATVRGMPLQAGVATLPNNVAIVCTPQVGASVCTQSRLFFTWWVGEGGQLCVCLH